MNFKVAAAIDIGSSSVRMQIAEQRKPVIKSLEILQSDLYLGRDTFTKGKITFEKIERLCAILNSYLLTASEYGVSDIDTIATTAFREATNQEYILDLVKLKTGIDVQVLDDLEEKSIIYREILRRDESFWENIVLSYVGTGSLGIAVLENGLIKYTQNIRIGSLKLSEILEPVEGYTKKFHMIVEQYINTYIDVLKNLVPVKMQSEFVAAGKEIDLIASLIGAKGKRDFFSISKKDYLLFYESIKELTPEQISTRFDLSFDRAETLVPSAAMFKILMSFSGADTLTGCNINMCDALIYKRLYPNKFGKVNARFEKSTLNSAMFAASRFRCDKKHISAVFDYSTIIFDSISSIHGMGVREKLILQVACILHDCGKFINLKEHYKHSYNLVKNLELPGLNSREILVVANICKYHGDLTPSPEHENYSSLTSYERVMVAKLSSIIRLGDTLDKSHLQKFISIGAVLSDNLLTIKATTVNKATLEKWAFTQKSEFFNDVFGIHADLQIERKI